MHCCSAFAKQYIYKKKLVFICSATRCSVADPIMIIKWIRIKKGVLRLGFGDIRFCVHQALVNRISVSVTHLIQVLILVYIFDFRLQIN